LKAPQTSVTWSATSIPTLLLLVALSGSAVASTEIQSPCPESESHAEALHAILDSTDMQSPLIRTIDSSDSVTPAPVANTGTESTIEENGDVPEADDPSSSDSSVPEFTTRLPGVSANDMPRFRRHMFRTDI
jgi:ABC-type phosphate transport system substrate-binding protein